MRDRVLRLSFPPSFVGAKNCVSSFSRLEPASRGSPASLKSEQRLLLLMLLRLGIILFLPFTSRVAHISRIVPGIQSRFSSAAGSRIPSEFIICVFMEYTKGENGIIGPSQTKIKLCQNILNKA